MYDNALSGHLRRKATLNRLKTWATWAGMISFVAEHVATCETCQRIKPRRHAPYGTLKPLDAPTLPWRDLAMDIIGELPPSVSKRKRKADPYNVILVVVDRFSKMARFILAERR